jgi:ABC-2 type transport system ATP-binding protein
VADSPAIETRQLGKTYRVPVRGSGVAEALRSLWRREYREVRAVDEVSFIMQPGEIVGFLGPNGAGKTTTLKMLAGLLHPTAGEARVLGHLPYARDHRLLRAMTLVMGQRNQLVWDIPAIDSFERNRAVYQLPAQQYRESLEELDALLGLGPLMHKPVRTLSLGERMKCEVAAALLHRPAVLFLDEPTIGLDVTMQRQLRGFIKQYNQRTGATVLLTSHYMADVEALCRRVIVIHHGRMLFDGLLGELYDRFTAHKTVVVQLANAAADLSSYGEVVRTESGRVTLRVEKARAAEVTARLLHDHEVQDLTVEETPIEEVIDRVFTEGVAP